MTASATSRMPSRWSMAARVSIFATMRMAFPPRSESSSARSARTSPSDWTNDSATKSAPQATACAASTRSLSVSAANVPVAPGAATPLWEERRPPATISISIRPGRASRTTASIAPSSNRTVPPGRKACRISGCGSGSVPSMPSASSRSTTVRRRPIAASIGRSSVPRRIFGPERSARMATVTPAPAAACRTREIVFACSAGSPWE